MHLPSRDATIDKLAESVGKLTSRHSNELRHLLGKPPNVANVPASFWAEIREEMDRELVATLMLLFLASVDSHGGDAEALQAAGSIYASQRSAAQAARYSDAIKSRLETLAERTPSATLNAPGALSPGNQGEPGRTAEQSAEQTLNTPAIDAKKIADEIKGTFDAQAERIAASETTNAETAGGDAATIDKFGAVSQDDIWRAHPSRTKSGTCNRCRRLDGTKRKQWGQIDVDAAGGPALHDNCACTVEYADQTQPARAA